LSQVFENQSVFISRPTQRAVGQGRAAPPFQGFSAESGFACWLFLPNPALAANASRWALRCNKLTSNNSHK